MADPRVDARTRANTAKHFMDRVLFDIDSDTGEKNSGYREILRRLDEVDKSLGRGVWFNAGPAPDAIDAPVNGSNGARGSEPTAPSDPLTEAIKDKLGIDP